LPYRLPKTSRTFQKSSSPEPERPDRHYFCPSYGDTSQLLALLQIFQKTGVRVEFSMPEGRTRLACLKVYLAALLELEEVKVVTGA
jgi:hypothetical protein